MPAAWQQHGGMDRRLVVANAGGLRALRDDSQKTQCTALPHSQEGLSIDTAAWGWAGTRGSTARRDGRHATPRLARQVRAAWAESLAVAVPPSASLVRPSGSRAPADIGSICRRSVLGSSTYHLRRSARVSWQTIRGSVVADALSVLAGARNGRWRQARPLLRVPPIRRDTVARRQPAEHSPVREVHRDPEVQIYYCQ